MSNLKTRPRVIIPACDNPACQWHSQDIGECAQVTIHLGIIKPTGYLVRTLGFCGFPCLSAWALLQGR